MQGNVTFFARGSWLFLLLLGGRGLGGGGGSRRLARNRALGSGHLACGGCLGWSPSLGLERCKLCKKYWDYTGSRSAKNATPFASSSCAVSFQGLCASDFSMKTISTFSAETIIYLITRLLLFHEINFFFFLKQLITTKWKSQFMILFFLLANAEKMEDIQTKVSVISL